MNKTYTASVERDYETGDQMLTFTPEFCDEQDWRPGGVIKWDQKEDGTIVMTNKCAEERKHKKGKKMVLVETVSMFRMRYVVYCDEESHALDEVVCKREDTNFKEFSQEHLDEIIVSHRAIDEEEFFRLCEEDNAYLHSWTPELKLEKLTNTIDYSV